MSGPKGYTYRVESAAERAARELRAAQQRCADLENRLKAANATLRNEHAEAIPAPAVRASDAATAARREHELRAALAAADTSLGRVRAVRAGKALAATLSPGLATSLAAALPTIAPASPRATATSATAQPVAQPAPAASPDTRAKVEQSVARALAASAVIEDAATLATIRATAERAVAASSSSPTAQALVMELRTAVNTAVQAQRTQEAVAERAAEAVLGLPPEDSDAQELRCRAAEVTTTEALADLERRATELRRQLDSEADDEYVTRAAAAVLAELGYAVEILDPGAVATPTEPRSPTGPAGTVFHATRPDLPGYALQLRVLEDSDRLVTNVVALGESTPAQDAAAEALTCTDVVSIPERLSRRGVSAQRQHALPAGAHPVQRATGTRSAPASTATPGAATPATATPTPLTVPARTAEQKVQARRRRAQQAAQQQAQHRTQERPR